MFGKVKNWLGIEGVKIELIIPEEIYESAGSVTGKLRFYTKTDQTVNSIKIKLIERYSRGRKDNKLTDEYELGEINLNESFKVTANEPLEIDFTLPFKIVKSEMDEMGEKNILSGGLVKAAKWLRNVKSIYRVEAEANVKGVALNPFTTVSYTHLTLPTTPYV